MFDLCMWEFGCGFKNRDGELNCLFLREHSIPSSCASALVYNHYQGLAPDMQGVTLLSDFLARVISMSSLCTTHDGRMVSTLAGSSFGRNFYPVKLSSSKSNLRCPIGPDLPGSTASGWWSQSSVVKAAHNVHCIFARDAALQG